MRYIYRLLLVISATLLILSACGSSMNQESNGIQEATVSTTSEESATEEMEDVSENEEEQTEVSENIEEAVESPEGEASSEQEDVETAESESEVEVDDDNANLTAIEQSTVEMLVSVLDLEMDQYSYFFTHEEDYIEIEVRESATDEQSHAPLEGIYRYYPVTQEVFISDYLTGDFILYEEYQELQNS